MRNFRPFWNKIGYRCHIWLGDSAASGGTYPDITVWCTSSGWEEVGSVGRRWVIHSPAGRTHPMTALRGCQAWVLWWSWGRPRPPPDVSITQEQLTHTELLSHRLSQRPNWKCSICASTRICQHLLCTSCSAMGLRINSWFMPLVLVNFLYLAWKRMKWKC